MRPHPPAPALVIQHVEWEGPHRIAGAMTRAGVPVVIHRPWPASRSPLRVRSPPRS
jgi:hypothetical protein